MGVIDLHIHTSKSPCGLHSLLEILELAREKGMSMVAITDHDVAPGHAIRVFSYRFPPTWKGLRVLKGIELSIRDGGKLRIPPAIQIQDLDLCLAGFHPDGRTTRNNPKACIEDLGSLLARYPFIDILTHPFIKGFELEPEPCADLIAQHGAAVEVNNSALRYGKENPDKLLALLALCKARRIPVAVNSDTHAADELGNDQEALGLLAQADFPEDLILNASAERVLSFIESRRARKTNQS